MIYFILLKSEMPSFNLVYFNLEMKKHCFFILIIVFTFHKCKADVCDDQANADIVSKALGVAAQSYAAYLDPKLALAAAQALPDLVSSIFGRQGDTTCALNKKLDQILEKLGSIESSINELKSEVLCQPIMKDIDVINQKIYTLLGIRDKKNEIFVSALQELCSDPTEGINKIYSNYEQLYFNPKKVGDYIKHCSNDYDVRRKHLMNILFNTHLKILTLITSCEEAYGIQEFDTKVFNDDMAKFLEYYNKFYIHKRFVEDPDKILEKIVKRILDESDNAESARQKLTEKYDFYNWDVIYYSKEVHGYEDHTFKSRSRNSWKNGAFFFKRTVRENKKTGAAAYSLKKNSSIDNPSKDLGENFDLFTCEDFVDWFWKKNGEKKSYLLCLYKARHIDLVGLDFAISNSSHYHKYWNDFRHGIMYIFYSKIDDIGEIGEPSHKQDAVILPNLLTKIDGNIKHISSNTQKIISDTNDLKNGQTFIRNDISRVSDKLDSKIDNGFAQVKSDHVFIKNKL